MKTFDSSRQVLLPLACNDNLPPYRWVWVNTHYACGGVKVGLEPHNWSLVLDCAPIFNKYRGKPVDPLLKLSQWELLPDTCTWRDHPMPMDFPDMQSLKNAAEVHKFRVPKPGEEEREYRTALADHVQSIDLIESMEIRTKHGWNQFTRGEQMEVLARGMDKAKP